MSADHVVILILLLALAVKYVFFEERDELAEQLLMPERTELDDSGIPPTRLNMILRRRFGPLGTEPLCRMDAMDEGLRESEDRAVQTDDLPATPVTPTPVTPAPAASTPIEQAPVRSIEECLEIAKSEVIINLVSQSELVSF